MLIRYLFSLSLCLNSSVWYLNAVLWYLWVVTRVENCWNEMGFFSYHVSYLLSEVFQEPVVLADLLIHDIHTVGFGGQFIDGIR